MGAALGEMVTAYSASADDPATTEARGRFAAARGRFLELVGEDSRAYADTVAARRAAKSEPGPEAERAWTAAIRHAADVPLETARLAWTCAGELEAMADLVRPYMKSDWTVALALLSTALQGALANVNINLDELRDRGAELGDIEAAVRELAR